MSDEALIAELERHRESAREYFEHYARQGETLAGIPDRLKSDISEITSRINAVLGTHPVFGPGRVVFFGDKPLNLYPASVAGLVAQGLLRMMLRSDAQSAVASLHRLFQIDRADLRMVAAVHGLDSLRPVRLSNGVRLLPPAAAPDSVNLRMLAREHQASSWSMEPGSGNPPTIAVFDMGTFTASTDETAGEEADDNAYDALLDAARAFTLTDRGAAVVGNLPASGRSRCRRSPHVARSGRVQP